MFNREDYDVTFLEQDCSSITCDIILQVRASRQPVGQIHGALLPTVKVTLCPAVKPGTDGLWLKNRLLLSTTI